MSRRNRYRVAFDGSPLESRATPSASAPGNLFHQNGVDGLKLHASFVNRLNDRFGTTGAQVTKIDQAFQVFETAESQLPVNPPAGSTGPTLSSLLATLQDEVDYALGHNLNTSVRPQPSQRDAIKVSPLAPQALIPYADEQLAQLGATLAATPPTAGPDGTPVTANPIPAINVAANAISYAMAESSVHPNLFTSPGDYYVGTSPTFTYTSTGAPAESIPGIFVRGPHGALLPGAILHPYQDRSE